MRGQVKTNRNVVRKRMLQGSSLVTMLVAGFAATPAIAQATPGSTQCPIVSRIVTCSGNLPEGVRVPAGADRDGLTVENLTADITLDSTTATARPAIDYTAGTPTSTVRIVDPDNRISVATAASATAGSQNQRDRLTSAILLTATNNSNFSLLSDIDIVARATCAFTDCIRRNDILPNGITVRGSLGNFAVENRGDISLDIEANATANPNAILVDVFNADLVTIRNSGNLTAVNAGGIYAPIYARRIEITNDGSITLQNDRTSIGGISLQDFDQPYADGYVRPAMPESINFTYRIVNNGPIRITGSFGGAGIRHNSSYVIADGFIRNANGTGEIVNNGTIVATTGILLSHSGEVTITNNGRIEGNNAMLVVQVRGSKATAAIARIANTASGVIVGNQGITIDGEIADVSNAGRIEASGASARAIYALSGLSTLESATIGNSGQIAVTGNGARAVAVSDNEGPTVFTNSGTIAAEGDNAVGLYFGHESFDINMPEDLIGTTEVDLAATSVIRGGSGADGEGISFFGGERNVVRNAGLISSQSGRAIVGGAGAETIDNGGRIDGSVLLGAGNDRVIARDGGLITGAVDGGAGSDTLAFDISSGGALIGDRVGGTLSGFELLEKTGAGMLTLSQVAAPRAALLGGALVTTGDLSAMGVDASGGTTLNATGRLAAVTVANGATFSPGGGSVGTIDLASLSLAANSRLRFDLGAPGTIGGTFNDLINVSGNLTLDGMLDVNARPNFGSGVYRLINYGGALTDNGLILGAAPAASYSVQTSVGGQVNLVVGNSSGIQFWDGSSDGGGGASDGLINGGSGTWSLTEDNWTTDQAQPNDIWRSGFAVFQGARLQGSTFVPNPGTVTIVPAGVSASGLQFAIDGYRIEGGPLTLTAPATIRVGDGSAAGTGYAATIASPIGGSAGIDKTDLGTLVLTGVNGFTGGLRISGGAVQVSADTALGAAAGGITLDSGALRAGGAFSSARGFTVGAGGGTIDTGANALTLSGSFSGSGSLTKIGSGTLAYSGNGASFTGITRLNAGTLNLGGTLGGALVVASGATLTGTGTAASLDIAGTVSPGNSPGTLTATGDIVFRAGSTYRVELAASGATDRINAGGRITIEGGTVAITTLDPDMSYTTGTSYRILNATGGLSGTFAGLTESSAFLDFSLGYDATGASVRVAVIRTFPDVAQTFNQRQSSRALAAFGQTAGSDSLAVYNAILLLDAGPARVAFDAASGEIYPVTLASSQRRAIGIADQLIGRANSESGEGLGMWGGASGQDGAVDNDGNGARYRYDSVGGDIGLDYRGTDNAWAIGIAGGYGAGDTRLASRGSSADLDGWHAGGYLRYGDGGRGLTATAGGTYSDGKARVSRAITIGTLAPRTAGARVDVATTALSGELRYGLPVGGGWAIGPVARISYANTRLGGFTETGAGSLNLSGGANLDDRTRYGGGLFARWSGKQGSIDTTFAYLGGGGTPTDVGLLMAGAGTTPYRVRSARGDGDSAAFTLAGRYELGGGWAVGATVAGAYGRGERSLQGNATLHWRF